MASAQHARVEGPLLRSPLGVDHMSAKTILAVARSVRAHSIGGMEDHLAELYRSMVDRGWSVHVLTAGLPDSRPFSEAGVRYIPMPGTEPVYDRRFWRASVEHWTRLSASLRPTLAHVHSYAGRAIARARAFRRGPLVVTLYGTPLMNIDHHAHQMIHADWRERLSHCRKLVRVLVQYACGMPPRSLGPRAHVIAISRRQAEEIRRVHSVAPSRLHQIDFGIDIASFDPPTSQQRGQARGALGFEPQDFVIGTVCRLVQEKGVQIAIRAMPRLLARVPTARLLIVGDGDYRRRLEGVARSLGLGRAVVFQGAVPPGRVVRSLHAMDVFALNSVIGESFGLVVAQAMSCALPVVASRVGAMPQLIGGPKPAGYLVPRGNSKAFAGKLCHLASEPAVAALFGRRGRQRAVEEFSHDKMVECTTRLFESLADSAGRATRRG